MKKTLTTLAVLATLAGSVEYVASPDDVQVPEKTIIVKAHAARPYERFTVDSLALYDTLTVRVMKNSELIYRFKYIVKQPIDEGGLLRACVKIECVEGK